MAMVLDLIDGCRPLYCGPPKGIL